MSDIFREIDEEVRRDKAVEVWSRYRNLFIAAAVLLVIGTAVFSGWQTYRKTQAEIAAARFEAAIEDSRAGRHAEALATLSSIATEAPDGYRALARFRAAAELGKTDAVKGAAAFDALATDRGVAPVLQGLASLRGALLLADTLDRAALQARLQPLLAPGQPWAGNARELIGLAALKAGDYDEAGRAFDMIVSDSGTAPSLRQRAELYLGLVRGGPVETLPKAP